MNTYDDFDDLCHDGYGSHLFADDDRFDTGALGLLRLDLATLRTRVVARPHDPFLRHWPALLELQAAHGPVVLRQAAQSVGTVRRCRSLDRSRRGRAGARIRLKTMPRVCRGLGTKFQLHGFGLFARPGKLTLRFASRVREADGLWLVDWRVLSITLDGAEDVPLAIWLP